MLQWKKRLSGNAKWLIATEPGWSIPMPWVFYYMPLYLVMVGVGEIEYGALSSLSRGLSIAAPLFAMPVAAKLGLKRAFLVLDTISNVGMLLPLAVGKREPVALAFIFSGLAPSSAILWEVLLVEGTGSEALVAAYSVPGIIYLIGNLLTPLAGIVLNKFSLVEGYKLVVLTALSSFLAKTAILVVTLKEPGSKLEREREKDGLREAIKLIISDGRMRALLLFSVFSSVIYAVFGYQSLYLCDDRGPRMTVENASLIPSFSSTVSLATLTFVTAMSHLNRVSYLTTAAAAGVTAYILYALSSTRPALAFAAALASGLRGAEFSVSRAYFVDLLKGSDAVAKGHAISLLYTLSSIVTVPAPMLVGLLYSIHPVSIWLLALSASSGQLIVLTWLTKHKQGLSSVSGCFSLNKA
ncbi:MAG: MFS transporter [Thermofilaceae archaeon]